jgi:hypothetical protein
VTPRRVSPAVACAEIVDAVATNSAPTAWIGVDGGTGAGKSRFARRLAVQIPGAVVVAVDDFSGPQIAEWDWDRFRAQVLSPILAGRSGRYQRFDWADETLAEWRDVPAGAPVIVEGVSATRREAGVPWTVQVWIDASRPTRVRRVLSRGGPPDLPARLDHWLASESAYLAREQPMSRVDLVVDGD